MAESLQEQSIDPSFASGLSPSPEETQRGDDTIAPGDQGTAMDTELDATSLLVKGDLVRVSEEGKLAKRSLKDRSHCLGRVTNVENGLYDIEWVVDGGGAQAVKREYLVLSFEDEQISNTRRKRKQPAIFMKEKILGTADLTKLKKEQNDSTVPTAKKPPVNKLLGGRKLPMSAKGKKTLPAAKNGTKKSTSSKPSSGKPASAKTAGVKRKAAPSVNIPEKKPTIEDENSPKASDVFERHRKDFERTVERLEKLDKFGFFLDEVPPEYDERYYPTNLEIPCNNLQSDGNKNGEVALPAASDNGEGTGADATHDAATMLPNGNSNAKGAGKKKKFEKQSKLPSPQFPSHPPFNWAMIRRRMEHGRYVVDREKAEEDDRFKRMKAYYALLPTDKRPKKRYLMPKSRPNLRVVTKFGIDWNLFLSDVESMCDAALARAPDETDEIKGTCAYASAKVKEAARQACEQKGGRHTSELRALDDIHKFMSAIETRGNTEAAMQSWRKEPFGERRYERLKNDVICAGLSGVDERAAIHELRTNLPDSFVGLSYRYDDTGQSEAWMKSVVDETGSASPQDDKVREAQRAMAVDDGVIRAQVNATMNSLLIGVQDRVMTETGVLKEPELRSANWLQALSSDSPIFAESADSRRSPEVIEQPVWGIDCYTRRNITTCLEIEFDPKTALEFVEKWLLPAINACPGDLGHDIDNACKILAGEPVTFAERGSFGGDPISLAGQDRQNTLRQALLDKISNSGPVWLELVANELRRARSALGPDFFRIHPKGHGSILLCPRVEANTLVTFYRGEVYPGWRWGEKMDAIEITQQRKSLKPALPDFYNMALERPQSDPRGYGLLIVDASRKAGHGSSVSHSCAPTCEVRVTALNGVLCLAMTTIRELEMGEELTFDYNAVTESLVEYSSAVCLCGYGKCRGSFLHYATADCYQQVLNRNAPLASRFATLVKASMKKVMAEDDERVLRSHGFQTAAFGAVSFNRREQSSCGRVVQPVDSMDFVPIWLRTFVADTLRYIEYERRALPIALICDHLTTKNSSKVTREVRPSAPEKEPSRAEPAFFYFVRTEEKFLLSLIGNGEEGLSGIHRKHALNKVGAAHWNKLSEVEKQAYKDKAQAEFEKKKKALLGDKKKKEKSRPGATKGKPNKNASATNGKHNKKLSNEPEIGEPYMSSSVSFQDADAEGISTMEQRIQQLTQTLSRIGRVLDRHRENLIEDEASNGLATSEIDASSLQSLVHSPVSVLSDASIIGWLWTSSTGVFAQLSASIGDSTCSRPLLMENIRRIQAKYVVLDSFGDPTRLPSTPQPPASTSGREGRRMLTKALLEIRRLILREIREMGKIYRQYRSLLRGSNNESEGETTCDMDCDPAQSDDEVMNIIDERVHVTLDHDRAAKAIASSVAAMGGEESASAAIAAVLTAIVDEVERRHHPDSDIAASEGLNGETSQALSTLASQAAKPESAAALVSAQPWLANYHERCSLLAAADLLLFYAHTKQFFTMNPYSPLTSSPIEVYARELGNAVPKSAVDACPTSDAIDGIAKPSTACSVAAAQVDVQADAVDDISVGGSKENLKIRKQPVCEELCDPAETVAKVTVGYNGDYVVSQLLQWYNGGIGQKPGLPDVYGCMVLPPIDGCWVSDLSSQSKAKPDRRTVKTIYESTVRPRMITWLQDPYQRGNQWPDEVYKAFVNSQNDPLKGDTSSLWLPIGSPVVDFLVTGDESSILAVLAELDVDDKVTSKSASAGLLASVDKGRPAQAVCSWVQCENPECNKWRKIPWHVDIDLLPEKFYCSDNKWDPSLASCDVTEEDWDDGDKLVKDGKVEGSPVRKNKNASLSPTSESNFYIGARFDVQRTGKDKFTVATVTKFDFSGATKRIMFHFQRTSDECDEWVEFGSPRIAALFSKVPKAKKKPPAASKEATVPCEVTSASVTAKALPLAPSSSVIPNNVVSNGATAAGASGPDNTALVQASVAASMLEITPSPKNSSSSREAPDLHTAATKPSAQKRPATSTTVKRAPTKKKVRPGKGAAAASPQLVGTQPHPMTFQSNKVYEALSLKALDRYKEKTSSTEDPPPPVPFPFGNTMANPMYIGFMNALAASSFYPGATSMPPAPNGDMEPPRGMTFCPPMLNHSNQSSPACPPTAAFPPFPPPPFSMGSLELLTQAASTHSNGQQDQAWGDQAAQGRQSSSARDDWRRFFGPSSNGGNDRR